LIGNEWSSSTTILEEKIHLVMHMQPEMDIQAMERALSESTPGRRQWVTKHITGHFMHGKNMVQRGQRLIAACPQCQAKMEDKQHII